MKKELILIQMGIDPRIPREAIGYVRDLAATSGVMRVDRLNQLRKYVPDLVAEFEAEEAGKEGGSRPTVAIHKIMTIKIATIRANDDWEGEKIVIFAERVKGGYLLKASNGDDVGYYKPQSLADCRNDAYGAWHLWDTYEEVR